MNSRKVLSILLGISVILIVVLVSRLSSVQSELGRMRKARQDGSLDKPADKAQEQENFLAVPEISDDEGTERKTGEVPPQPRVADLDIPSVGEPLAESTEKLLIRTLLTEPRDNIWRSLGEMGIEVTNEDFRNAMAGLGEDAGEMYRRQNILRQWTEYDPASAAEWVVTVPEGRAYTQAVRQVVSVWAGRDPDAVGNWLTGLEKGKDEAIRQYLLRIAYNAPRMAEEWYSRIEDKDKRLSAAPVITGALAAKGLDSAIEFVEELPSGRHRDRAVSRLVYEMAKEDPLIAFEWAATIDTASVRENSVAVAVGQWARLEPAEAGVYINELSGGALKDKCLRAYSLRIADDAPSTAMEWAQSISDRGMRESVTRSVAFRWARKDSAAAQAWISQSDLGESVKEGILMSLKRFLARTNASTRAGKPEM